MGTLGVKKFEVPKYFGVSFCKTAGHKVCHPSCSLSIYITEKRIQKLLVQNVHKSFSQVSLISGSALKKGNWKKSKGLFKSVGLESLYNFMIFSPVFVHT